MGTHLLATLFATLVLVLHGAHCPPEKPAAVGTLPENAAHAVEQKKDALGREIANGSVAEGERVAGHKGPEWFLVGLLAAELMALGAGFWTHHRLNHSDDHAAHHDSEQTHRRGVTNA